MENVSTNAKFATQTRNQCPNCHGEDLTYTMKSEPKYKGAGWSLAWLLIFIPVLGWIILFVLKGLEGQTVSRSYAVCNNCGENFRIYTEQDKLEEAKKKKSKRTWLIILLIFCSPLILAIVFAIFSAIFGSIAGIFTGGILI